MTTITARPRWGLKSSFITAIGIVAIITPLILLTVKKSIWTELEIVTGIISVIIFCYLSVVLYLGVRFDKKERFVIEWPQGNMNSLVDATSIITDGIPGIFTDMGSDAGIAGIVIGIILDVVVSIVLAFLISLLFWLGFNGILAVIIAVCLPLFYFYRRVLRSIILRGRNCRGNPKLSMILSIKYTLGYSLWFYGVFCGASLIQQWGFH